MLSQDHTANWYPKNKCELNKNGARALFLFKIIISYAPKQPKFGGERLKKQFIQIPYNTES